MTRLRSLCVKMSVTNRELPTAPRPSVAGVGSGACSKRACFFIKITAPLRVGKGFQHGASTESREVVIGMTSLPAGMWPGKSQLTAIGGGLHCHVSQTERVAPDERGWRRSHHPPPCNLYRLQVATTTMTSLPQRKLPKDIK
jgi:hypothetical protein